jgi:hypothetical protein
MFCLSSPTQPSSGRAIADPEHYPRIGFMASYLTEGRIYAKHILSTKPEAKIAVLYQNDDLGKGYLKGLRDELGPDRASMIVKEASYETSEPTVDSQVVTVPIAPRPLATFRELRALIWAERSGLFRVAPLGWGDGED